MVTVIKFYADWCQPCKAMEPVVEQVKERLGTDVIFTEVNIEDNPGLRQEHNVRTIPTFLVFKDSVEVGRRSGSMSASDLGSFINESRGIRSEVLSEQSSGEPGPGTPLRRGTSEPEDESARGGEDRNNEGQ